MRQSFALTCQVEEVTLRDPVHYYLLGKNYAYHIKNRTPNNASDNFPMIK